ncbi:MAG TPA: SDR family oxidoreductase [Parafilimonas sp.]|nr:SDR family oxidoreductase [Parafilimonas sp.]
MDLLLKGKKAFISGSTSGIGFATAKRMLSEDATVVINGRSTATINKAVDQLKKETGKEDISGIAADFSKTAEVDALLQQLPEIDILINNAGIFEPKPFTNIPDEDWLNMFEVNVMSGIRLSRFYFPKMLQKNWGRIIFISSESGVFIPEEMIHYGVTKTAQLALSRGLAELTKGTNVTVNAVLPGPTKSQGAIDFINDLAKAGNISTSEVEKNFFLKARPTSLLQRFASPDEVANMITYIASPLASATNGAALRVDGGVVRSII